MGNGVYFSQDNQFEILTTGTFTITLSNTETLGFSGGTTVSLDSLNLWAYATHVFVYQSGTGGGLTNSQVCPYTIFKTNATIQRSVRYYFNVDATKSDKPIVSMYVEAYQQDGSLNKVVTFFYTITNIRIPNETFG